VGGDQANDTQVDWRSEWFVTRDGTRLSAKCFLPEGDGPWPVLLEALPYRKDDLTTSYADEYRRLRDEGDFAVVRLDLRGTGASEGLATDEYPLEEQTDLVDVIALLAAAPWSTGRVGMFGTSYSGFNSLQIAAERPPALGAICAIYASDDRYTDDVHYIGGTLRALDLVDYVLYMTAMAALPPTPALAGPGWRDGWRARIDELEPWLLRWMHEQWDGPYWRQGSIRQHRPGGGWQGYERIEAATMIVAGWADGYRNNTFRTYEQLRCPKQLLAGPWSHMAPGSSVPGPRIDLVPEMIQWFDRHLRADPVGAERAPIRLFMRRATPPEPDLDVHRGEWRAETDWPPAGLVEQVFVGPARTDTLAVRGDVGTTAWISCAGHLPWGQPVDQRPDDGMSLVYDWPVPDAGEISIAGHARVDVVVSADVPVASLSVKLNDVFPDGTSTLVTRGFLNLCHRNSSVAPEALVPGEPVRIELMLEATAWIFEPGHTIRLAVAGADWPNAWAPPTPVTLTIDAGSLALRLPVLAAAPTAPTPRFSDPPAPDAHGTGPADDDSTPVVWRIEHDVLGRETRAVIRHDTAYPGDFGAHVRETYAGTVAVSTEDPGAGWVEATARYDIAWPDVSVATEARLHVRSDGDAFAVDVELDVTDDAGPVAARRWTERIPRRLQ